jgi:ABC-type polysaccharide/polyol phosphate export permease
VIPLTHFVTIVREIILGGARLSDHSGSLLYVIASGFVFLAIGIGAFELVRRSVRASGLVTGY